MAVIRASRERADECRDHRLVIIGKTFSEGNPKQQSAMRHRNICFAKSDASRLPHLLSIAPLPVLGASVRPIRNRLRDIRPGLWGLARHDSWNCRA
jgi:hypothetical protein